MSKSTYNEINYPKGSKVIIKNNEPESYKVGTLKGFTQYKDNGSVFPIVDVDGKELVVWGIMRLYHANRAKALDKLTPIEQWNVLAEFHILEES